MNREMVNLLMSSHDIFPVPANLAKTAWCDDATYREMYARSIEDPEGFWAEQAERLDWIQTWSRVKDVDFTGDVRIRWFEGAKLNACVNCIDRHLPARAEQTAILWEGDDPADDAAITYGELYEKVCRLANLLKAQGVAKGDRVTIYMPMIPEAAYAMLACAGSARFIRWCSAASRPIRCPGASTTAKATA